MVKKILIAGRERNVSHFVSMELQRRDYLVDYAGTGEEAFRLALEADFDLVLMSFQLPDMSGQDLAKKLIRFKPATVMIVAVDREDAETHGDEILTYAVSYVIKPFVVTDLVDQVEDIFRGRDFIDANCKQIKLQAAYRDLQIDFKNRLVSRNNEVIPLTRREYDLLTTLMTNQAAMTREQLVERVWQQDGATETNVVDVYIRYLRGKLDVPGQPSYIRTIRGVGYAMRES